MREVAIFSTSIDEPTYKPVAERLVQRGYEPWVYNADRIVCGTDQLSVSITDDHDLSIRVNDTERKLHVLRSAWFRHPDLFNLSLDDKAKQLCVEQEVTALQESLWLQVPETAWLNHPQKMKMAQAKLAQLALAKELGFKIPNTIVSNDWSAVTDILPDDLVIKMSKGLLYEANQTKVLYTTVLDKSNLVKLQGSNAFPAIYQEYLDKAREWRITVVGDDAFEAAIYTSNQAKDDWRRHQLTSKVRFERESMPGDQVEKCILFLKRLDLTYGAFDFVEASEGTITFLECNTNGQFRWLEDMLGLPISDAITNVLVQRYKENS